MRSMSGFGKSIMEFEELDINVEIKSVNSRFLDFYIRSPKEVNEFENDLKSLVRKRLSRGKIELFIHFNYKNSSDRIKPNYDLLDRYDEIFDELIKRYRGISSSKKINNYLMVKDSIIINDDAIEYDKLKEYVTKSIDKALDGLVHMREKEGVYLQDDLLGYISELEENLQIIEKEYPDILKYHKDKIKLRVDDIIDDIKLLDKNVLETELAIYAEKKDISEEILRLKSHISQFKEMTQKDESVGRKLDFITQELNREVNTIGSKCVGYEVSNVIIDMKSIIERIREQVQNVE